MGRAAVAGLLGLAVGFALGLAVRGCGAPQADERVPAPGATGTIVSRTPQPRGSHSAESRPLDASPESSEAPDATANTSPVASPPAVREVALDDAPTGWADLEVEFVGADGTSCGSGQGLHVVRSPEGPAPLAYESGGDIRVQTDADGRARTRVASPGRYDVWTTWGMAYLVARGVDVPGTRVVRLQRPEYADLKLVLEDAAGSGEVAVAIESLADQEITSGGTLLLPSNGGWSNPLSAEQPTRVCPVVAPLTWRIAVAEGYLAVPSQVHAPAEVRVRRSSAGTRPLKITWSIATGDVLPPLGLGDVAFDLRLDGRLERMEISADSSSWSRGVVTLATTVPVSAASGLLRWSGDEIETGSVAYDLALSDCVTASPRLAPWGTSTVRLDVADGPAPPTVQVVLAKPGGPEDVHAGELVPGEDATIPASRWLVALPSRGDDDAFDDRVAGPVMLRGGARDTLRYVRGGYVVVVPRGRLPTDAAPVEIARADGAPIVLPGDGEPDTTTFRTVTAGTVLGPFEPGTVTLDVFVARVRCARYEVTIRAGEHTPLPVGPLAR